MSITDKVLGALQTAMPALSVHDAHVPRRADGTPLDLHYVVVYPDLGALRSASLCTDLSLRRVTFRLVYVSNTRNNVETFANAARAAILNKTFTDDGWSAEFDPDDHHETTPVRWDESIADRLVMYATDEFVAQCHKTPTP